MRTRSGNALVLAFGITAMVASMVVISATSSTQIVQSNVQRTHQLRCLAAVEAVLQRREAGIIALAQNGALLTWTGVQGVDATNFGEDIIGGCRVRWKVEPMRTLTAAEAPTAPPNLPYVTNPSPNVNLGAGDPDQQPNTVTYLYRVAAEAVILERQATAAETAAGVSPPILAKALGVRAVSATNNPLFRYVIMYAARGAKGDLELSHGPALDITGNVYSAGSIYMGADVSASDWLALGGPFGQTTIVSALPGNPARVWGLDGIYRQSKPLMYARLNGFPIANGLGALGVPGDADYDLTTASYPNEAVPPTLGTFATATNNGRSINPRRVKVATGLVPGGTPLRTINGIELATTGLAANDSRDLERPAARSWAITSRGSDATSFAGQVQSQDTGAVAESIDPRVAGDQALEAQLLQRVENDGDPTTDEHHLYRPHFFNGGLATPDVPNATPIEAPGVYMGFALGAGLAMQRQVDNAGWTIVTQAGAAAAVPAQGSLIIRERPIPDTNIWPGPGGDANAIVPANNPNYLPYAYGKHWRPTLMPVTPIDVTEDLMSDNDNAAWAGILQGGTTPITQRTASIPGRSTAYAGGGTFQISAAASVPGTNTQSMTATIGNPNQNYQRVNAFMRDNWRFMHLKIRNGLTNAQILALPQGLRAYAWMGDNLSKRLLGIPDWTGLDVQADSCTPWAPNATGNPIPPAAYTGNNFSIRWEGYLVPPVQGNYTLGVTQDDGVRIWVDDQLVYEKWNYPGGAVQTSAPISLSPQRPARIVIDFYEAAGEEFFSLQWQTPVLAMAPIPAANLRAAPALPGFARTQFQGAIARVDLTTLRVAGAPPNQKVGLMLREAFGAANMLNGRDRYVALLVNPNRGIFVERRMQASTVVVPSSTVADFWVAQGTSRALPSGSAVPTTNGALGVPTDRTNAAYEITRDSNITLGNSAFTAVLPEASQVSDTNNDNSVTTLFGPPTLSATVDLNESTKFSFKYGNWQKYRTRDRVMRQRNYITGTFRYDFVTYRGGYPPAPYAIGNRPNISIFSATNTSTTPTVIQTWTSSDYGVINRTYLPGPIVGRALTRTDTSSIYGPNLTKSTDAYSGDISGRAIWATTGWPPGWTDSAAVARLNALNWNGGGWIVGGTNLADPSPAQPSFTLADLDDPVGTPGNPAPPLAAGQYSFSVPLSNTYTLTFDTNPMIGAGSQWGNVDIAQTRPWLNTWTTLFNLTAPPTRSFRPDLWWSGQVAPPTATNLVQLPSPTAPQGRFPLPALPVPPLDDLIPAGWAGWASVWLRIQHAADGALAFQYANGATPAGTVANPWQILPVLGGVSLGVPGGAATAAVWADSLLVGPALQSGSNALAMTANLTGVAVNTTENIGNNDGIWNNLDWDAVPLPGVAGPMARYMASQYQVFFANQDITEDFFSWADQVGGTPIATEDWFYNLREFWSQNRRWDDGTEKDAPNGVYSHSATTNRELLAKSTMLILDQGRLWQYLSTRDLAQAMTTIMQGDVPPAVGPATLSTQFNGLVYAVRTNRYPFNPDGAAGGPNPWSASATTMQLPNAINPMASLETTDNITSPGFLFNGVHKLQPYGLAVAPPFRPQTFHHGVMLTNGANVNWGNFTPVPPAAAVPPLGTGATSIVTPNQLYVVGNLNTTMTMVATPSNGNQLRPVPMAIMGDSINFLSNNFNLANYKLGGFIANAGGTNNAGTLGRVSGFPATSTAYNAAIVTYNQPSTWGRVREGQSAAVIDTMQFMENWDTRIMTYGGSLVVLGTRRYTEGFLLNVPKSVGRTPFGTIGWLAPAGVPEWNGFAMQVYNAPARVLNYNTDLLTQQGTPPFAPSGVTTASVGGWVRIVQ